MLLTYSISEIARIFRLVIGTSYLKSMINKNPMDELSAHLDRGWDLVNRGDFNGAQTSAEKSLELDSKSPEVYNLLGYIQAAQGNIDEALLHYREAISLDDTFVEAILNAAELLIHPVQDFKTAIGMVDEALELAQNNDEIADALLLKIDAFIHQDNYDQAARVAARLPEGPFENPILEFLVGRAKFEVGDIAGAERMMRQAVVSNPDNSDCYYYLGLINENLGNSEAAVIDFLKSRALDLRTRPGFWSLPEEHFEKLVRNMVKNLGEPLTGLFEGTLIVISDLPGVEVITEGIDPRIGILVEESTDENMPPRINRLFVYRRNLERISTTPFGIEEELRRYLEQEITSLFPSIFEEDSNQL